VIEYLFCEHEESFEKLPRLLLAIKELNLEIVVNWTHKGNLDDNIVVMKYENLLSLIIVVS